MKLTSTSIVDGAALPLQFAELAAGGNNLSPALSWSEFPEATRSFALTCYDPDAPTGSGWWHWINVDIPATTTSLAEGEHVGIAWTNDYGYEGYGGACPPPGPAHRYVFRVYALDVATLAASSDQTSAAVRFQILAHTLDQADITALFAQPSTP